jgi:hypothetical protein
LSWACIAVALEQSVEFVHHRSERAELREVLAREAEKAKTARLHGPGRALRDAGLTPLPTLQTILQSVADLVFRYAGLNRSQSAFNERPTA